MAEYNDYIDYGILVKNTDDADNGGVARVTAVLRERFELMTTAGPAFGKLKGSVYYDVAPDVYPTVGDFVALQDSAANDGLSDRIIIKTMPRKSQFLRRASSSERQGYLKSTHAQAIAANFDICFVVTSMNRDLNAARLERYLSQAWQSGATPVVVLTKADLEEDYEAIAHRLGLSLPGVMVIPVSVMSGIGLTTIREIMPRGTSAVLLGSSGVGKSSLVNALLGASIMRVNAIREDDAHGRHTTTHRQMIHLPWGALIIDTPGMRELGMWDASDGIDTTFSDVLAILNRGCKFSDCRHESEPGCAVRSAIDSGELDADRWRRYCNLESESRYVQDKAAYLRDKSRRFKEIAQHFKTKY